MDQLGELIVVEVQMFCGISMFDSYAIQGLA